MFLYLNLGNRGTIKEKFRFNLITGNPSLFISVKFNTNIVKFNTNSKLAVPNNPNVYWKPITDSGDC